MTCISPDADDFDPDAGFVKTAEGDQWEGEDADLEVAKPSHPSLGARPLKNQKGGSGKWGRKCTLWNVRNFNNY